MGRSSRMDESAFEFAQPSKIVWTLFDLTLVIYHYYVEFDSSNLYLVMESALLSCQMYFIICWEFIGLAQGTIC